MLLDVARRLRLGRALYLIWHAPRGVAARARRQGVANLMLARLGERAMRRAASRLVPAPPASPHAPEVYFLTGRAFAHQTAFCAVSLAAHAGWSPRFVVIDDGTLRPGDVELLIALLPSVRIVGPAELDAALEARLPRDRFPVLRRHRLVYPHLRKLTDVHALAGRWKLVLDSDMLFHARPDALLAWMAAPTQPCHMIDVADAYGYPAHELRALAGRAIPARVNVGVCGLDSTRLNWDQLERWAAYLLDELGQHYLLEQALTALVLASEACIALPSERYVVAPSRREAIAPTAALHHYTAESKAWYFRFAWHPLVRRSRYVDASPARPASATSTVPASTGSGSSREGASCV